MTREDVEVEIAGRVVHAKWEDTPGGIYGPGYWITGPPAGMLGPAPPASFGMAEPTLDGQWDARRWDGDGNLGGGTLHASLEEAVSHLVNAAQEA